MKLCSRNLYWLILVAFIGVALLCAACLALMPIVWLPDLLSPDADRIIGRHYISDREYIELTQLWVGDGYATCVDHWRDRALVGRIQGDSDGPRAFSCAFSVRSNSNCVDIRFQSKTWHYYHYETFQFLHDEHSRSYGSQ